MMISRLPRLLLVPWFCLLGACGWFADKEEEEEVSKTAPRLVGRVASIHEAEGFVLVENFRSISLGEGLLLSTRGAEGRAATLVVSGERMGRYAAADMKSGNLEVGDEVYARPLVAEEPSTDLEWQQAGGMPNPTAADGSPSP